MIKLMVMPIKKGGGPGIFMHRLLDYMQDHEMIQVVEDDPDIYLSTVWRGKPPRGCKTIYRAASVYYNAHDKKRKGMNTKLANAILKADHVIYQTDFARKLCEKVLTEYLKYTVKARKKTIITNGFNARPYAEVPPYQQSVKHRFVACADWIATVKRGADMVAAFRKAQIEESELVIIGKHNDKRLPIRKSDIRTGLIRLLGPQSMTEIASVLKSNAMFVQFSYAETCPNAAIEAMSFGCPVVCNNIGGTPEIVQKSGVIAKCDDPFIFRRRALDISMRHMGAAIRALRFAAATTWNVQRIDLDMSVCAAKYKSVFEEVLG